MPKVARALTTVQIRNLPPGLHAVGEPSGLCVAVQPSGSKQWILRAMVGGRRRSMGLGGFPEVSLSSARDLALDAKRRIRDGRDPIDEKAQAKAKLIREANRNVTLREVAEERIAKATAELKSESAARRYRSMFETYVYPVIGPMRVSDVGIDEVLKVLEPIWTTKPVLAGTLRGRLESVLDAATAKGLRSGLNPVRWKANLELILPRHSKVHQTKHHAAIPIAEVPAFMAAMERIEGTASVCARFMILTASRSIEAERAEWSEVDLKAAAWTIPGSKIKAGKDHVVPLSQAAIELLRSLPRAEGQRHVFRRKRADAPWRGCAYKAVKQVRDDATCHGFRSSFKDWARNETSYADEVSELCLAHVSSDATRAAYARDGLLDKRRAMLEEWANFIS